MEHNTTKINFNSIHNVHVRLSLQTKASPLWTTIRQELILIAFIYKRILKIILVNNLNGYTESSTFCRRDFILLDEDDRGKLFNKPPNIPPNGSGESSNKFTYDW